MGIGHAQFLAFVDVRGAAVHVQQQGKRLRRCLASLLGGVVAPAGDDAWLVMVIEEQAGPAGFGYRILLAVENLLQLGKSELGRLPLGIVLAIGIQMLKQEQHV